MELMADSYIPPKRNLHWIILGAVSFVFLLILVAYIASSKECSSNDHCPDDAVCARHKCVDGCVGVCGPNTTCHVINHVAVCACHSGHVGNPITGCQPTPPPPIVAPVHPVPSTHVSDDAVASSTTQMCLRSRDCHGDELCYDGSCRSFPRKNKFCYSDDDCTDSQKCFAALGCLDPCVNICDSNATCEVVEHNPVCSCKEGYIGNPYTRCTQEISQTGSQTPPRKKRFRVINDSSVNWHQALMQCLQNGSQLASIDSEEELGELNRLIMKSGVRHGRYWTSGSDVDQEGHFLWGSTGTPISMVLRLWKEGEPNNYSESNEDCVELWEKYPEYPTPGYFLNDVPCTEHFNYICEYYEKD